jgi:hypothetical protein
MNLKEGTRRLALLLGAVGAIFGGFSSYLELHTILEQGARHNKFEQLADSDVVQRERKCRLAGMTSGCSDDPYAATAIQAPAGDPYVATAELSNRHQKVKQMLHDPKFYELPSAEQQKVLATLDPDYAQLPLQEQIKVLQIGRQKLGGSAAGASIDYDALADQVRKEVVPGRKYEITEPDGTPLASELNKVGIKTVHWAKDYGVESIETGEGQTLYPTPAPSAWTYLLIALFPILGFFIPWGAVRAIGWVGAGFAASPK